MNRPTRSEGGRTSLYRNSIFLMTTQVILAGFGYVYWVGAAREFHPAAVGLATSLISAMTGVSFVGGLGVTQACVQILPALELDKREWNKAFTVALVGPTIFSVLLGSGAGALLIEEIARYSSLRNPWLVFFFAAGCGISCLASTLDFTFIALRRSGRQMLRNAVFGLLRIPILVVGALLLGHAATLAIVASWTLAMMISVVTGFLTLWSTVPTLRLARGGAFYASTHWRLLVGNQLTSLGGQLPGYVFPLLVVVLLGATANAYFYFAWSTGFIFFMISYSASQAMFSEVSNDRAAIANTVRRAVVFIACMLLPVAILTVIFGGWVLDLFGSLYSKHGLGLLRLLALSSVPDAVTNVYVGVLQAQRRAARAAVLSIVMCVISLATASLLLPYMGISAVGWAWLTAQGSGTVWVGVIWLQARGRTKGYGGSGWKLWSARRELGRGPVSHRKASRRGAHFGERDS